MPVGRNPPGRVANSTDLARVARELSSVEDVSGSRAVVSRSPAAVIQKTHRALLVRWRLRSDDAGMAVTSGAGRQHLCSLVGEQNERWWCTLIDIAYMTRRNMRLWSHHRSMRFSAVRCGSGVAPVQ